VVNTTSAIATVEQVFQTLDGQNRDAEALQVEPDDRTVAMRGTHDQAAAARSGMTRRYYCVQDHNT